MKTPTTRRLLACSLCSGLLAGLSGAPVAGAETEYTIEAGPPPQLAIDLIDEGTETNTGVGVATLANDNPTTWAAEDGSVLGPGEEIVYRLHAYVLSADVPDCADYELTVTIRATSDGPQIGTGDNMFMGTIAGDTPLTGQTYESPGSVGSSIEMVNSMEPEPAQLREGLDIVYGATTHQSGLSSGYTMAAPVVDLVEDLSACDLDGDGVSDDTDPDNTDFCVPDPMSTPCVEAAEARAPEQQSPTTTTQPTPAPADQPETTPAPIPTPSASPITRPAPLRPTG
ncbi:MAG: hypothetical protein R2716_04165 [Microthrixaceae bacterium]